MTGSFHKKEAKLIPVTQIHDRSLSWLGTGISIKKKIWG
jgi:hypothetical protein